MTRALVTAARKKSFPLISKFATDPSSSWTARNPCGLHYLKKSADVLLLSAANGVDLLQFYRGSMPAIP